MQVAPSHGQICNQCKWCHVVAEFQVTESISWSVVPLAMFGNRLSVQGGRGHYEAIATTQPDAVHNLIGMTALVMWPKLPISVKSDDKVTF